MDKFFTQTHCDRCGGSLKGGRIMSMYNTDCICLSCKDKESKRDDYGEAVKADHEEIKKGNYNYKGIKGDN
ncbi:gamma-glutamylcyclotransferase [Sutcliffiella horikoshii]|uniref:Gamma-glutamylcyclotransferase n=1 Tax=Sutcliffiella horikoshii TaxID=79883 RepID=A0A5D4T6A1_9BACI|nr:gamma-glutamylcyclotransferase [Sutcliffiella horikoshii]TYS69726.1 gamma-glutamylcyclotransferase [Sutcliffiella horikoshii]